MDDIIISNEYNEFRNQRVIMIYGDNDKKNGEMEFISSSNKSFSYYHSIYFVEHGKFNYLDDEVYQNCLEKASKTYNVGRLLFLHNCKYNNIVFTETTKDDSLDRYGILYLPIERPNEAQFKNLSFLLDKFKDFREIMILGIPVIVDGILNNRFIFYKKGDEIFNLEKDINDAYDKCIEEGRRLNKG